ncbi:MAG: DEAD/DEAH box helicase [Caldilineaceae bacterium]
MALPQLLADLRGDVGFMANVMAWRTLPPRPAHYAPYPPALHPALRATLAQRGIRQLYSHQAQAVERALAGQHLVVVTPTASGKTLCYNLPVLHTLLHDEAARALYLFPTKALAQDQLAELTTWRKELSQSLPPSVLPVPATYDGDTPSAQRAGIRTHARLILTNPDMLHMGILPYHTAWEAFLANLRYVVLDELHTYRGVFGSHVANVLRRLQRLCAFYGAHPQFICASATIANPQQLAEKLVEQPVTVIQENGAPSGAKEIILYNPPLYDAEQGLRRSALLEAQELTVRCLEAGLQTILFGRSRLTTEVLLTYLRERMAGRRRERMTRWPDDKMSGTPTKGDGTLAEDPTVHERIRGYRGGYLPTERRAIEAGLRSGEVQAVVATNALELGIDIGSLQAAVLCGYPGTIAGVWQQMGRAGRTQEGALAILVATGGVLDQYIIQHPDYIFERSPEHALINPDNLMLLVDQVRCAAFELPFQAEEMLGRSPYTTAVLALLTDLGELQQHGERFFGSGEGYPARRISLRSAGSDTVAIQVGGAASGSVGLAGTDVLFDMAPAPQMTTTQPTPTPQIIGQIDQASAPLLLHAGAIYIHEGQSYRVEALELAQQLAVVTPVEVDYYTEVTSESEVEALTVHAERAEPGALIAHGDLLVRQQVVGFRRIKRFTHETLGVFPLDYPPRELETSGYWFSLQPAVQLHLAQQGQWFDSLNDYGPNWQAQRQRVRARDGYRCTQCGAPETPDRQHDVHHLRPFRTFGYAPGLNEHYRAANQLSNLILVCRTCHQRLESGVRTRTGLDGLAYALTNIAPLHLMCDPQDLGVHVLRVADFPPPATSHQPTASSPSPLPTIYLYERIAAGLGFSARLFELHHDLLVAVQALVRGCACQRGCPGCVGPVLENELAPLATKELTVAMVDALLTMG